MWSGGHGFWGNGEIGGCMGVVGGVGGFGLFGGKGVGVRFYVFEG